MIIDADTHIAPTGGEFDERTAQLVLRGNVARLFGLK